jgi:hypothetical protein
MRGAVNALKAIGFKRSAKGARYGISPRLVLDNVEAIADSSGIGLWVNHPGGLFAGPHRKISLDADRWTLTAAMAVVAAVVEHRNDAITPRRNREKPGR